MPRDSQSRDRRSSAMVAAAISIAISISIAIALTGCTGLLNFTGRRAPAPIAQPAAARAPRRAAPTPTTPSTPLVAESIAADPPETEPTPAASDSAGVARLVRLAQLWHTVALHHPWIATRGVPWDSALIIAVTRVRAAKDPDALQIAYTKLVGLLHDPVTRVEPLTFADPTPIPVSVERTPDSTTVIRIAPSAALDALDSAMIAQVAAHMPARLLLDLRGAAVRDPVAQAARLDAFLQRTEFAQQAMVGTITAPVERTRRIGVWPTTDDDADMRTLHDGWQQPSARSYRGLAATTPRMIALADSGTVLPPVLLALHDASRLSLFADGGLRDASPVTRVRVPISDRLMVTVRVGELVHDDGSFDVVADSTIGRGSEATDRQALALAKQSALTVLRGTSRLPFATRPEIALVAPARTPVFYDTTSYPFMGARVLGGFRLWSAMRARHAHRDLYDDDLDAVFERVIPKLEAAQSAEDYAKAIADLATSTDDAEAALQGASMDNVIGAASLPFRVRSAEGRLGITDVVRDSMTTALNLVPGTEILTLDGYPIVAWLSDHRRIMPAANDWTRLQSQLSQFSRGRAVDAVVRVRDLNKRERTISIPRKAAYRYALPSVERPGGAILRMLDDGLAYVDVERITNANVDSVFAAAATVRGLVLDLRGRLHVDDTRLLRHLATRPHASVARLVQRTLTTPCLATLREAAIECPDVRESRAWLREVDTLKVVGARLVALIDERTQGAMERFALTLEQMSSVSMIGSASAGAISWTTPLSLPGGLSVGIATQELRRTDGGQVQRVGLNPIVEVHPTARGLRARDDEVLARAQQWLTQQLESSTRKRR